MEKMNYKLKKLGVMLVYRQKVKVAYFRLVGHDFWVKFRVVTGKPRLVHVTSQISTNP